MHVIIYSYSWLFEKTIIRLRNPQSFLLCCQVVIAKVSFVPQICGKRNQGQKPFPVLFSLPL